jgi:RNA polymerase sigma factor (sigma-70 family)
MARAETDVDLLEQWSAGSREAGNQLIERHFDVVYRFFRNKVGTEIDDLVQQTFLGCLEARARYQGQATFKTFLLAIAHKQLYRHYDKQRRQTIDVAVASLHDLGTSPSGVVARREDHRLLVDALRRVPLEAQLVLELAFWEGLDGNEIAHVLEVPLNTAYTRLRRAKNALRVRLEQLCPDRAAVHKLIEKVDDTGGDDEAAR